MLAVFAHIFGSSYKPGNLLSYAMEVLRCGDVRTLVQKCGDQQEWQKLRKFFKGVRVSVPHSNRKGPIQELIPEAGYLEFTKDGHMLTVQVCRLPDCCKEHIINADRSVCQEHFKERYGLHIQD